MEEAVHTVTHEYHLTMPKGTRVEVIDSEGRVFTQYYRAGEGGVYVSIQDDGRTVKVFAGTPGERQFP